jgi:membrane-associated phospholipid phosphatase
MKTYFSHKIILNLFFLFFLNEGSIKAQLYTPEKNPNLSFSIVNHSLGNKYSSNLSSSDNTNTSHPDLTLFSGFGNNIINSFKGNNLYLHLAGVASTAILVTSNTDYYVEKFFNEHEQYGEIGFPIIRMSLYFPFIIGGSLYAYGKMAPDEEAVGASFAVLQSSVIAFMYNSLLKAITGRPHPDWRNSDDMKGLSKTFRFGFMQGGIFWGWPSGHTSSTMVVVSALTNFYPEKTWLKIAGYGYVAYMMFAVSSLGRGGMHWFSDAVAAAFMAYAIGSTTGKFYRDKFRKSPNTQTDPSQMMPPIPFMGFTINF